MPTVYMSALPPRNHKEAIRTCLKCSQGFQSEGPQNRMCKPCKESNAHIHTDKYEIHGLGL